jgi:hypothetical protein
MLFNVDDRKIKKGLQVQIQGKGKNINCSTIADIFVNHASLVLQSCDFHGFRSK